MPPSNSLPDDDLLPDERALLEQQASGAPAPAPAAAAPAPADDDTAAAPAPAPAAAEPGAEGEAAAAAAATTEADGEGSETDSATTAEPVRPTYEAPEARDFGAELKGVRDEQAALRKQWSDGELGDDEYNAKLAELEDRRDAVLTAKVQAETIENLNRQAVIQTQQQVLAAIRKASMEAGQLDYTDVKNATAFDKMLGAVMADPENGGKSFPELAQAAHDALCAVRGVKAAAPAPSPAPSPAGAPAPAPAAAAAPAAPTMRGIPPTLGGIPQASANPVSNDAATAIVSMDDPDQAEAALASLPASQRAELLRSTIRPNQGRR